MHCKTDVEETNAGRINSIQLEGESDYWPFYKTRNLKFILKKV